MIWEEKAIDLLRNLSTPWGIKASLTDRDNYSAIFTRDAVMSGIAGIFINDEQVISGLVKTLYNLKKLQGKQGQIASNYKVENNEISDVSYGTLSPKIDACTWYLIGIGLAVKHCGVDKNDFFESAQLTIDLLDGLEYNSKDLVYIPKGGNWADEYIYDGYVLYDQLLRCWALKLLGEVFQKNEWEQKAELIENTISKKYIDRNKEYLISSVYPGGSFDYFDLAANSLACIVLQDESIIKSSLQFIIKNFLEKESLPPAFYPVIKPGDEHWETLRNFSMFRFKNEPHHFHNGGIWYIWLGWLSVALSINGKQEALDLLYQTVTDYLGKNESSFDFHEYVSSDKMELHGTVKLGFTATGLLFLHLAKNNFDFNHFLAAPIDEKGLIQEPIELKPEYIDIADSIIQKLRIGENREEKLVIGIAGESGSGKTTTAICLRKRLNDLGYNTFIIHQDSYFHLPPKENHEKRKQNFSWVGLDEIKMSQMQQNIKQFRDGFTQVSIPIVDYAENRFTNETIDLSKYSVLIVEGVYAMYLEGFDHRVFLSKTYHDTKKERMARIRETYDPFVEKVLEKEHQIVISKAGVADLVIEKDNRIVEGRSLQL